MQARKPLVLVACNRLRRGPDCVVVASPALDDDLGVAQSIGPVGVASSGYVPKFRELGYRLHLLRELRRVAHHSFAVYSTNFWSYDAELGFNYAPNQRADLSMFVRGQMRCLSFVADAKGNPGKPRMIEGPQRQVFVFGDSMTFYHYEGDTWPIILQDKLNAHGDRTEITNFARDGTGILQMIDTAAAILKRGHQPDLIIVAFITEDLIRRRFWRKAHFVQTVPSTFSHQSILR
jgi:GDSL-like lipase/acylhydrolase family protein